MTSHENYEKRSLNMEFNMRVMKAMYDGLTDRNTDRIYLCGVGLMFVKDYLPDGTPCWRQPTKEEREQFEKEK